MRINWAKIIKTHAVPMRLNVYWTKEVKKTYVYNWFLRLLFPRLRNHYVTQEVYCRSLDYKEYTLQEALEVLENDSFINTEDGKVYYHPYLLIWMQGEQEPLCKRFKTKEELYKFQDAIWERHSCYIDL